MEINHNPPVQEPPTFNLEPTSIAELQKELFRWQDYNFGKQKDRRMVLGICEESGELCHAHLKLEQGIRGNRDDLKAQARDAIGDIAIYALNLLSNNNETLQNITPPKDVQKAQDLEQVGNQVLAIFCSAAKIETARRMKESNPPPPQHRVTPVEIPEMINNVHQLFMTLNHFCAIVGWDLTSIIHDTWKEVGARDWKRFPKDGKTE